ncbi:MAG: response regulator [Gammaproteobacteria bacterium]|nr:response regulator [Gammaproteobacteria bacterium]MBU2478901.1 response regulator [Gammaproteobacteria bacterium]
MNTSSGTILVVEDEAQIRKFLRISLEAHGFTVEEARLGEDGLKLCATAQPHLVILDLGLPDMDGQDFILRLREWSQVPVVVLSVRASEQEKVQALDAGANDYVTKPFGISELMARIRVVLRSHEGATSTPTVFEAGGLHVDLAQREVSVDDESIHLSKKEYELLRLLINHPGRVLTHQQILREIWGPAQQDETHYLRVLVGQLRQKLGDDPTRPRFIITVQGVGYRLAVTAR